MRRRKLLAALGVTGATALAGCGSSDSEGADPDDDEEQSGDDEEQATESPTETPTATLSPTPRGAAGGATPTASPTPSPTPTPTPTADTAKLFATDYDYGDKFGCAVALAADAETAVIGAKLDENRNGEEAGAAYVFAPGENGWDPTTREQDDQRAKLLPEDGAAGDWFGASVATTSAGTTAVVGAPEDDDSTGATYVFERSDGSWSQETKLTAEDGDDYDSFGKSVAVSVDGSTVVVGAYTDEDPNGEDGGSAYVFGRSDGSWGQRAKLVPEDGASGDRFGSSVAVSGDGTTAVVGAGTDSNRNGDIAGSAYVFSAASGSWSQQARLLAADGTSNNQFGDSVGISNDGATVLVGARLTEDPNGANAGAAYVFTRSGDWGQQAKLVADDGDSYDQFGSSVAVSADGRTLLVGARRDEDPNGEDAGSAYRFTWSDGNWRQTEKLTLDDGKREYEFGGAVSLSERGDTALVGAGQYEREIGAAYVYEFL